MSGSFDNLPRLQSLDEGEYGKISAGLRPPHSIFTTGHIRQATCNGKIERGTAVIERPRIRFSE
jgi:hypothetical protein